jgi:hypothetical protein
MDEPILKRRKLASPKAKGLDQLVQEFGERFVPIPEYNTIGMCRVLKDMSRELHRYDVYNSPI